MKISLLSRRMRPLLSFVSFLFFSFHLSLASSLAVPAITTLEIAVYRIHTYKRGRVRAKENSIRAHLLHTHAAAYGGDGYRGIHARMDTQGSTLMARATGGSSKVTYPRKPRVSFPFYSIGPFSRNLYLPTYVPLRCVPIAAVDDDDRRGELELLDPSLRA